jgi:uncharacterized protein
MGVLVIPLRLPLESFVVRRLLILLVGHLCLCLGFIGLFVPILPTVPFFLLAAFSYSRTSERFHSWLITHPRFGPAIVEWRDHRVIRSRAKILSVFAISISVSASLLLLELPRSVYAVVVLVAVCAGGFILSCPSTAPDLPDPTAKQDEFTT